VVLKDGHPIGEERLERELVALVRQQIGALACFRSVLVVKRLPKTRSGKILRKTLRQLADGEAFAVPSTIDDPLILDELRPHFQRRSLGQALHTATTQAS
jgi:propionyl-CoA synthetase